MIKCEKCNGTGFVPLGPGLRGIKKCHVCNGTGELKEGPETISGVKKLNSFSVGGNLLHPEEGCHLTLYNEDEHGNESDSVVIELTPEKARSLIDMLRDYTEKERIDYIVNELKSIGVL